MTALEPVAGDGDHRLRTGELAAAVGEGGLGRLLAAGVVHTWRGGVVVAGPVEDPLVGETQVVVLFAPAAALSRDGDGAALCRSLRQRWPSARRLVFRVPPQGRVAGVAQRTLLHAVDAAPRQPVPEREHPYTIRLAREHDQGALAAALVASILDTYQCLDYDPRPDAVEAAVADVLTADGGGAMVAEHDGRLVGYAVWLPAGEDDLTGEPHVEVLDIDALPDQRDHGIGKALQAALWNHACARSWPLRGTITVTPGEPSDRVLRGVVERGWTHAHDLVEVVP